MIRPNFDDTCANSLSPSTTSPRPQSYPPKSPCNRLHRITLIFANPKPATSSTATSPNVPSKVRRYPASVEPFCNQEDERLTTRCLSRLQHQHHNSLPWWRPTLTDCHRRTNIKTTNDAYEVEWQARYGNPYLPPSSAYLHKPILHHLPHLKLPLRPQPNSGQSCACRRILHPAIGPLAIILTGHFSCLPQGLNLLVSAHISLPRPLLFSALVSLTLFFFSAPSSVVAANSLENEQDSGIFRGRDS